MQFTSQAIALFLLSVRNTDALDRNLGLRRGLVDDGDCSVKLHSNPGVNNWEEAKTFCESKGAAGSRIANKNEICPNGRVVDGAKAGYHELVPMNDKQNGWLQVSGNKYFTCVAYFEEPLWGLDDAKESFESNYIYCHECSVNEIVVLTESVENQRDELVALTELVENLTELVENLTELVENLTELVENLTELVENQRGEIVVLTELVGNQRGEIVVPTELVENLRVEIVEKIDYLSQWVQIEKSRQNVINGHQIWILKIHETARVAALLARIKATTPENNFGDKTSGFGAWVDRNAYTKVLFEKTPDNPGGTKWDDLDTTSKFGIQREPYAETRDEIMYRIDLIEELQGVRRLEVIDEQAEEEYGKE
jgi:hypothetical protein